MLVMPLTNSNDGSELLGVVPSTGEFLECLLQLLQNLGHMAYL